ncbi:flagellar export protein FliJ [Clostridium neuense]|uniref:Flagellar FliJ protein n=1 Tax=Clostridium neuense TaxID=1728934 RepID=A0ABW8TGH9_9CLOT
MGKFNFRLQKLLDLKFQKEEQSKIVFKKAQEEKLKAEEKLASLKDNYKKYSEARMFGTVIEQKITHNYLNALTSCIDEANIELNTKSENLEKKRKELVEKQIERKTVETLKEKQKMNFELETKLVEQRFNDELALYGYIRKLERR